MSEHPFGYTPQRLSKSKQREVMRNRAYQDGLQGRPKTSSDPEYLTSYRRGKEQKEANGSR